MGQIWLSRGSYDFPGEATPGPKVQNCQIDEIFRGNYSEEKFKKTTAPKDYTN
jgi:hypothetical protein